MSGHNKWSQIKNKKGAVDAKKSREFGKLSRLITVEVKKADGNADSPGVRGVIERARAINMPNENIERAVARGKSKDTAALEEVVYEAYGHGGVALIIHGFTDNKNRAGAEVKHLLSLYGAALAAQGAASWAFSREGNTWVPQNTLPVSADDAEKIRELVAVLEENEDVQEVFTNADLS
ncbi:MAG: YebC/PmpR family DNA-binding transcriptional regulator [Parcubacteria group bacterium]|nr:YebC/PmpR family DNA-binding transcriptional regulator [Parcubacteria group bacterium]